MPAVPSYLRCDSSFQQFEEEWSKTDEKLVFITPSKSKTKNSKEKGNSKEKEALIDEKKEPKEYCLIYLNLLTIY